jgi:hypothetical protein
MAQFYNTDPIDARYEATRVKEKPLIMKTYSGSCHCGKVRFQVTADIESGGMCNCSICSRAGWVMASVPESQFVLLAGENAQTDYQFGKKTMHHLFCTTCGVRAFGRYMAGNVSKVIVNLRCLDGIDTDALPIEKYDGKSY